MTTTALRRSVMSAIEGVLRDDREEKLLCCRILVRLVWADGQLDPREVALLEATMERHGLDGTSRAQIRAELDPACTDAAVLAARAESLDALLDRVPHAALHELLQYLEWGAWADGQLVAAEVEILQRVRARLGIAPT